MEIPEDIAETASAVNMGARVLSTLEQQADCIARAILAERERCAKIARKEQNGPMYDGDQMWRGGYEDAAKEIEKAIMRGGTP